MTNTPTERLGYALGVSIGSSLLGQHLTDFEHASFIQGMTDVMKANALAIPRDELNGVIQGAADSAREKVFAKNKGEGDAFLAKNSERDEVTVLDSGLQYEVLASG
ncbi:MAG: FKBP-type peptidyl-prolyl cis-trans isomerase FklB, partial [Myxococcota bacterium]